MYSAIGLVVTIEATTSFAKKLSFSLSWVIGEDDSGVVWVIESGTVGGQITLQVYAW